MTNKVVTIGPRSRKQEMFISDLKDVNVVIFGGGAGSVKSYLGAMDLLRGTDDPKFRGAVVRRLTPQINGPGGIFETVYNLHSLVYPGKQLKVNRRDGTIRYPSGAEIKFQHCQYEDDKTNFQG